MASVMELDDDPSTSLSTYTQPWTSLTSFKKHTHVVLGTHCYFLKVNMQMDKDGKQICGQLANAKINILAGFSAPHIVSLYLFFQQVKKNGIQNGIAKFPL